MTHRNKIKLHLSRRQIFKNGSKSDLIILEEAVDPSACLKVTMYGIPVADSQKKI